MDQTSPATPQTPPATIVTDSTDDLVLPFAIEGMSVRGRVARTGPVISDILGRHNYPPAVSRVLAETLLLASMLGTALKLEGRFTVQTSSDGPVDLLVADMTKDGGLRGYAHFDSAAVEALGTETPTLEALTGKGSMALTIDQGPGRNSYQGVVPLEGESISACGEDYFRRSEQLPTLIKLVVAETFERGADGAAGGGWRAGGIMIQQMPEDGGFVRDLDPGDAPDGTTSIEDRAEDENWNRAKILMETVEDHELVDPALASETLLFRLYHEDGVRAFAAHPLSFSCRCSQDYIKGVLDGFGPDEMADMHTDDGRIEVRCEFCSSTYEFDPKEFEIT
ncbi:MAG: Hsp33 family molecular chaperone [Candidatus Phaeomarinobacter sp.]